MVLETVVSAICPQCGRWMGLIELAQEQGGLTLGQTLVVTLVLFAIFG